VQEPGVPEPQTELLCTLDTIVGTLKKHGVAILPAVLSRQECQELRQGLWETMEFVTKGRLHRSEPKHWKKELQNSILPNHGMLVQFHGIGHSQAVWDVRTNAKVQASYKKLFGTEELTVSFDGISFGLPPELTGIGWHHKNWLHLDQGWGQLPKRRASGRRRAVQSWVTANDISEGDGTLQVLLGSHMHHEEFATVFQHTEHKIDWYKLTEEEVAWFARKGCALVNVQCKAGSQVFWDSRTVHAGRAPVKGRHSPHLRFVVYTCYSPRSWLSPYYATKKREIFLAGRMTSHWPHWPKMFGKTPRSYGRALQSTLLAPRAVATKEVKLLAGWSLVGTEVVPFPFPAAALARPALARPALLTT
jgi:hypothetical protein